MHTVALIGAGLMLMWALAARCRYLQMICHIADIGFTFWVYTLVIFGYPWVDMSVSMINYRNHRPFHL